MTPLVVKYRRVSESLSDRQHDPWAVCVLEEVGFRISPAPNFEFGHLDIKGRNPRTG